MLWEKSSQFTINDAKLEQKLYVCPSFKPQGKFELNNSKNIAFGSTFHLLVCLFSPLVKPQPWPFSSLLFFLLPSSLSRYFPLNISCACYSNPSLPLSCLFFFSSVSCVCACLQVAEGFAGSFSSGCLSFFCIYLIPAAVLGHGSMPNTCVHLHKSRHRRILTYRPKQNQKHAHMHAEINWPYYKQAVNLKRDWKETTISTIIIGGCV